MRAFAYAHFSSDNLREELVTTQPCAIATTSAARARQEHQPIRQDRRTNWVANLIVFEGQEKTAESSYVPCKVRKPYASPYGRSPSPCFGENA